VKTVRNTTLQDMNSTVQFITQQYSTADVCHSCTCCLWQYCS